MDRTLDGPQSWYSSYSFTTSVLDGAVRSASRPGRDLIPGKQPPVPIGQDAGCAPEPVWTQRLQEKLWIQRLEEKYSASARDRTAIARSSSV
jgi:hypothetical protein